MMHAVSRAAAGALAAFMVIAVSAAEPARELGWDDLIPPQRAFDDPFEKLTEDQIYDLSLVARLRERQANGGKKIPDSTLLAAGNAEKRLLAQSVDINGLLARREEITQKRRARAYDVNRELDGKNVRIPSYLLPLEVEGLRVTEFLLVPYVGACIHVPPPPPNQIVHVSVERAVDSPGLFAPVWVDGTLATQKSTTQLSLVDGTAPVSFGYTLQAKKVEPYE